jgi:ABC-2 type transport system ATP-binding protein
VLISTHILPEVEMTCSRVMIMLGGRILASDSPENLQNRMSSRGQIIAEIAAPVAELIAAFSQMAEVEQFDVSPSEGDFHRCALTPREGCDLRPEIFALVKQRGWQLRELTRNRHSLEDIYVQVTKPNEEEE